MGKHCQKSKRSSKLKVLVQVNTSKEVSKSGVSPDDCLDLVRNIVLDCDSLQFCGLMTIGGLGGSPPPSECFMRLCICREAVLADVDLTDKIPKPDEFVMSMG